MKLLPGGVTAASRQGEAAPRSRPVRRLPQWPCPGCWDSEIHGGRARAGRAPGGLFAEEMTTGIVRGREREREREKREKQTERKRVRVRLIFGTIRLAVFSLKHESGRGGLRRATCPRWTSERNLKSEGVGRGGLARCR